MAAIRRVLSRFGLLSDRRERGGGQRRPIFVGARLELDEVTVHGTARDLSTGGVFFETSAPLAPGLRGALVREGSKDAVPVRVTWARRASAHARPGIGLQFIA
jgi:hypothetical protein